MSLEDMVMQYLLDQVYSLKKEAFHVEASQVEVSQVDASHKESSYWRTFLEV